MPENTSKIIAINRQRLGLESDDHIDDALFSSQCGAAETLCVYGRMRPGGPDHDVLSQFDGDWEACKLNGILRDPNACIESGECPGLIWNPTADRQDGFLFTSAKLTEFWPTLDVHEGSDYVRLLTEIQTDAGPRVANVYVAADASRAQIMLLDGYNVHDDVD